MRRQPTAPAGTRVSMGNTWTVHGVGKQGGIRKDTDPYSGETLAEIVMANESDLDDASRSAAKAQVAWAARLPSERAEVMVRAAAMMQARHQEIVDWIIRESGGTRAKAELERHWSIQ